MGNVPTVLYRARDRGILRRRPPEEKAERAGKDERGMWRALASLLRLFRKRTAPCPACARAIERTRLKCPYCATWLDWTAK